MKSKVQSKKFILVLISSAIFVWSKNSNALTWGQIFSGAGTVSNSWNKEEQRQLERKRIELEVEKMNREAEIQKLEYQMKMQQLQKPQSKTNTND